MLRYYGDSLPKNNQKAFLPLDLESPLPPTQVGMVFFN